MASLADYNFSLEYQKGKDNTVADFLSPMENRLPEEEVEEVLCRVEIPAPGVKAMLDNADTPITERAEGGDDALPVRACSPLKKLRGSNAIMIAKPGPLPYSLGTLLWSAPTGLWASTR